MEATVVITTKNRKEELRQALISCRTQTVSHEVLVIDDASTDGTAEMVKEEFPEVRLERDGTSRGYIVQRNRAAEMARGRAIFSIDDDAEFSDPGILEATLRDLDADPRIGAVAIPYIEPDKANTECQRGPDSENIWLTDSYIGTAHVVRRDLFLKLGAYRENLIHQGEESDFCIRLLEAGYHVRLGNAPPIIHHESPKRDFSRMDYYGARNSVLFGWQNAPGSHLPAHLIGTTLRCLAWSREPARLKIRAKALFDAWTALSEIPRKPVGTTTYRLFRVLRKKGPLALADL